MYHHNLPNISPLELALLMYVKTSNPNGSVTFVIGELRVARVIVYGGAVLPETLRPQGSHGERALVTLALITRDDGGVGGKHDTSCPARVFDQRMS
jgi:hypothetical protein